MRTMRLVIFEGRLGWYWHLRAKNNQIVAAGVEPFKTSSNAFRSFNDVHAALSYAEPKVPHRRMPIRQKVVVVIRPRTTRSRR